MTTLGDGTTGGTNSTKGYDIILKHLPLPKTLSIRANSVNPSGGLAIDLGNDGVTLNHPGGGTPGPDHLQNFPVLTSASTANGATTISGTLNSAPSQDYRVDLYANAQLTPSGFGPGEQLPRFRECDRPTPAVTARSRLHSPTAVPGGPIHHRDSRRS